MNSQYFYFVVILLCFLSCKQEKSQLEIAKDQLPGTYFELKKDNIKLFLPVYFQEFSKESYKELIDMLPDSKEKTIEKNRFNYLKFSKGNTYYFRDIASSTLINVKMTKFMDFSKKESSYLLGILSNSCSKYASILQANCKKITAGYSGNIKTKVFKVVYELSKKDTYKAYNTIYLVTSNHKTFSINIFSNNNKDYNKFIEKIIVK
ncbi:MAG: hypothetical protein ABJL44_03930 [Algibacter sp.]